MTFVVIVTSYRTVPPFDYSNNAQPAMKSAQQLRAGVAAPRCRASDGVNPPKRRNRAENRA
jgi:hypothetical protein